MKYEDPPFIVAGRQAELGRLLSSFRESLAGTPQVLLVTGNAGVGKTALVRVFCRQIQKLNGSVVIASGECASEHANPYLPFIEIMGLLTGDVEGKLARGVLDPTNAQRLEKGAVTTLEILLEIGGDLVGLLVPGGALLARGVSMTAKVLKAGGLVSKLKARVENPGGREGFKPEQFYEQFTRVVSRLATKAPLVLAVDDLHWADNASMDMFFYLARHLQQTSNLRMMLLGTYRPAEMHLLRDGQRHPLEKIVNELRRYQADVQMDLERTLGGEPGRSFLDALLDSEPNHLNPEFRNFLCHRTDGHPLFTIEILRMLKQRGTLNKDQAGRWVLTRPITLEELPESVEAVIEERINRLEKQLRDILTCGSVEGEQFTAEIVARVRRIEEMQLANDLNDELERKHLLVVSNAEETMAPRRLHGYRFIHAVFQQYLYGTLSDLQRQLLHRAVGEALESLSGSDLSGVAVQLARHFDIAGENDKAIEYLLRAGDEALSAYANADAARHYLRAGEVARRTRDRGPQECRIAVALARVHILMGKYARAKQVASEARQMAEEIRELDSAAEADLAMGEACAYLSQHDEALGHLRNAAQRWERSGNRGRLADAVRLTALVQLDRNYYPEALSEAERALAMFRETGNRFGEDETLRYIGDIHCGRGEYQQGLEFYETVLRLRRETGNRTREGGALGDIGDVHLRLGNYQLSLDFHRQSLIIDEEVGYKYGQTWVHHDLGVIRLNLGELSNARRELEQALILANELQAPNLIVLTKNDLSHTLRRLGGQDNLDGALRLAREATETAEEASLTFGQIVGRSYQAMAHLLLGDKTPAMEQSRAAIVLLESHGDTEALSEEIYYNHFVITSALGEREESRAWLEKARNTILAKGNQITNEAYRESFFTNVPLNREISAAWQARTE